ncbi:MAG: DNA-binding protein [Ruminococcus sp.]|jgi:hypothetical protein|nr:DNA-binding protein [Ruminococcus sp.]
MSNYKPYMKVAEVVEELEISTPYAYKLIKQFNDELSKRGFLTIPGRVSRRYFYEKIYGYADTDTKTEGVAC